MAFDLSKVSGMGTEGIAKSTGAPFLQIIQKGSPQYDEAHAKYAEKAIAGCRQGDIILSSENRVIGRIVKVIVLATTTVYTEWKPKNQGGGFVANHPLAITSDPRYRKGAPNTPDQYKEWLGTNELIYTMSFAVEFLDGNDWKKGLLAFTSKQLKAARQWSKQMLSLRYPGNAELRPPIFGAVWALSTVAEKNEKGGWFGWSIKLDALLDPEKDEALLTHAFESCETATKSLPAPRAQNAIAETTVVPDDEHEAF